MGSTVEHQASLRRRALAYVLDAAVLGALAGVLAKRLGRSDERSRSLTVALAILLGSIYHVLLEGGAGQTLGKRRAGIVVVREDGSSCTFTAAATRTALRAVDWLPMNYLVGVVSIVLSERNQRVGDRAAGTVVVRTDDGDGPGRDARPSGGVDRP